MSSENNKPSLKLRSINKNLFQNTLNLPKTSFSIRANAAIKELEILERWTKEKLFEKSWNKNKGNKKFVLHDGPPYANGNLHLGHVLNKGLKDIVTKYKRMSGFHVPVKPGWDCHGLPIELKVSAELKEKNVDKKEFKKACRDYANKWIEIQKKEFENLGVDMDWDNPYITMDTKYESLILKAFSKFVKDGYIQRKGKSVPWCASCKTVLAAAEIEYKDRKDPSIYVLFPVDAEISKKLFPGVLKNNSQLNINFLAWTTTPWTLPLNRAVVLNSEAKYVLLQGKQKDLAFIVVKDLADKICGVLEIEKKVLAEFDSKLFEGQKVNHPFIKNLKVPILLDNSVLLNEGTACVHSAPGCGLEDYFLGIKNNLEIFSPLSADGRYTQDIEPKELDGMSIDDGQIWVLKKLDEVGNLLHKTSIRHSYPHCWRCHKGLMFRATDQWFCDLQKGNLITNSLKEIEKLKFVPDWGKARLIAFISNRTEWCISRQRVWGVPIPALICKKCDKAFLDSDFVQKIAENVAKEGIEFWDKISIEKMIELKMISKDFKCKECGNNNLDEFKKENDILDVWFDSGVSHYAVLDQDPENLGVPADMYLEGSDQHRGWFQSSLLSSMIINKKSCTKSFITHGFIVDEKGYKMSKSLGNVIAPDNIIKRFSRDILRLWVAASDYQNDVAISEGILKFVSESYRKIRNTCRFMISNLYDFDIKKDAISFEKLLKVDQYAMARLFEVNKRILNNYDQNDFVSVFHTLNNYCATDLSSLYLDICKDRLYVERPDGIERRSAQTVIYSILDTITRLMAPILSFLSEEVSDFYQKDKKESIHLQEFSSVIDALSLVGEKNKKIWNVLENLRQIVLKAIEQKRAKDIIKHSLESKIKLYLKPESEQKKIIDEFLKEFKNSEEIIRFFKDWFIISQFDFADSQDGLENTEADWVLINVDHAQGKKCPRCWQWEVTDNVENLCKRCCKVLGK